MIDLSSLDRIELWEKMKKMKIKKVPKGDQPDGSHKPYVLIVKKKRANEHLLDNPDELLSFHGSMSPLSGSEYAYEPEKYNDREAIKTTHNCYSYALGRIRPKLKSKAQPGYASGYNYINDNRDYNCKSFYERVKKDNPLAYLEKFDNACDPGFYKVFLALDVGQDYHWWRQNGKKKGGVVDEETAMWSHKPGSSDVTDLDASGKKIANPLLADRKYPSLNYSTPCFFMCVHRDMTRSVSATYRNRLSKAKNVLGTNLF